METKRELGIALSYEFWADFVEHHWAKKPLFLRQPFAAPFATSAETFRGLVEAGDQFRAGESAGSVGFYIEYAQLMAEVGRHLPEAGDGSVAGYAARMRQELDGRRFGLIVENFHAYDAQLWLGFRQFLLRLFEFTGIPGQDAKAVVWLGDYKKTPYGIHLGNSHTFMFVVEGTKRLRVWPAEFFHDKEHREHTLDYEQFLDGAITLEGKPGDVFYWPSGYWHIGESVDAGLCVAISVALFMDSSLSDDLLEHTARLVSARPTASSHTYLHNFSTREGQDTAAEIREAVQSATSALRGVSQTLDLKQALVTSELNRLTGLGFTVVPAPSPMKALHDGDVVSGHSDYPIIWSGSSDDELTCSANGHAIKITAHPNIIRLLERLNSGITSSVRSLIEEYACSVQVGDIEFVASPEEIRALLEKLLSLRAIDCRC